MVLGIIKSLLIRKFRKQYRHCICGRSSVIHPEAIIQDENGRGTIVIGESTHIRGRLVTYPYGGKITIGDWCYVGENTNIWSSSSIHIGDYVLIAHCVSIFDDNTHPVDYKLRREHIRSIYTGSSFFPMNDCLVSRPVVIKDDAWIGCNAIILKGVTIGAGAIVAAGSVVTKDVPDFSMVAGNPAAVIRYLGSKTT